MDKKDEMKKGEQSKEQEEEQEDGEGKRKPNKDEMKK